MLLETVAEYIEALDGMMDHTETFLEPFTDDQIQEYDPARKVKASWGQLFDYEPFLEHAIVHVSWHRRQIQRFKTTLREEPSA